MPQASDELRAIWHDEMDAGALEYLKTRGILEVKNGLLRIPPDHELTEKDYTAIRYLLDEWDYAVEREVTSGSGS